MMMRKNKKRGEEILTPKVVTAAMILLLFGLAEVFFDTWCGVQCRRAGYEIAQAHAQQEKLMQLQKKLQIEQVRLKSPRNLGRYAREKLDLTTPTAEQVIIVP